ncbi:MAG: hypothetical protein COA79_19720 [Planctomycetota bacterium]|nr:MAG: hypothetical protein COA79_19720 [Planctomycetota bacterium]
MIETKNPIQVNLPKFGIFVIESKHANTFQMKMNTWKFDKICKIKEGSGHLIHKKDKYKVETGDILYLPTGFPHYFEDHDPLTLTIVCFSRNKISMEENYWKRILKKYSPKMAYQVKDPWARTTIEKIFQNLLKEQTNQSIGYESQLLSYTQQLLIFLLRYDSQNTKTLEDHAIIFGLMNYIENNIHEFFSVPTLAKSCNMSVRKFSSLFKKISDESVIHWINKKRINYACRRLENFGSINHVSIDAGFNDLTNFYKVFKQHTGLSPKEYKNSKT